MKWSKALRQAFVDRFLGTDFSREEVEELIASEFNFDPDKAYKQALAKEAQKWIASYRDERRVRECFGYDKDGNPRFGWPLYTEDLKTLEKMEDRLMKQKRGLDKSLAKVQSRIWVLKHQLTIFDMIKHAHDVNESRKVSG